MKKSAKSSTRIGSKTSSSGDSVSKRIPKNLKVNSRDKALLGSDPSTGQLLKKI
jgi:hypothetical protein